MLTSLALLPLLLAQETPPSTPDKPAFVSQVPS